MTRQNHRSSAHTKEDAALYQAYRNHLLGLEATLKAFRIEYAALTYKGAGETPWLATSGSYETLLGFEKNVCRSLRISNREILTQGPPQLNFQSILSTTDAIRPALTLFDGDRAIRFAPDARDAKLWGATLRSGMDPSLRQGAMNCGLMFGEQWLSTYLDTQYLADLESTPNTTVFVLRPNTSVPNSDQTSLTVAIDLTFQSMEWARGNRTVVSSKAHTYEDVGGYQVPSSGEILYNYNPPQKLRVFLRFAEATLTTDECSLTSPPREIEEVGGGVLVSDEASGLRFVLGDSDVAAPYQTTAGVQDYGEPQPDSPSGKAALALLAIVSIALLVARLRASHRTVR